MALWRLPAAAFLVAIPLVATFIALDGPSATSTGGRPLDAATLARQLPLSFAENRGQSDAQVRYLAHGAGYTLFLTDRESVLALATGKRGAAVLRTRFSGAGSTRARAEHRLPGVVNILRGPNDRHTGIRTFGVVRYPSVYPGIDAVYHGNNGSLEYDFQVKPGADPRQIGLDLTGASRITRTAQGDLVIRVGKATVREQRPVAYQSVGGKRAPVAAAWRVDGSHIGFTLGHYDRSRPLVIDPKLTPDYGSFLGGTDNDNGHGIAVDGSGNVYVTGATLSSNFPRIPGRDVSFSGEHDVFVTKFNPTQSTAIYSDLIGGDWEDYGNGIAVDAAGHAYVTGQSASGSGAGGSVPFPTTAGAVQTAEAGAEDGFVFELNADGSDFVYSTYLGGAKTTGVIGSGSDTATSIAIDSDGNAYVTGTTSSAAFPGVSAANSYQSTLGGGPDAFVTRVNAGGTTLGYSTLYGGSAYEEAYAIALDSSNNAYIGGLTVSSNLPGVTGTSAQSTLDNGHTPGGGSGGDGFVAKFGPTGKTLVYSTYVGGEGTDVVEGLAVNGSGEAYFTGTTTSLNFLPLANALYPMGAGTTDAFLGKVGSTGSSFGYLTYLGGNTTQGGTNGAACGDQGSAVAVDSSGNAYVTGWTCSNPFLEQTDPGGNQESFLAKFNPNGSKLSWATYVGGDGNDYSRAVAVDRGGNVWVTGNTASYTQQNSFPTTSTAIQKNFGGGPTANNNNAEGDAFIAQFRSHPVGITAGPAAVTNSHDVSFSFSSAKGSNTFKCRIDSEAESACTSPYPRTLADGAYTFTVQAYDTGDATDGVAATRAFTVDSTAPATFDLVSPADQATTGVQPTFSWTAAPDATTVTYHLMVDDHELQTAGSSSCSGGTCTVPAASAIVAGAHTWKVNAVDAAGNSTPSSSARSFSVQGAPPSAAFTMAPNPALVGSTVSFDASPSAPGAAPIARYEWDLDGDGSLETDGGGNPAATKAYTSAGSLNVTLRVTDSAGATSTATQALRISTPGTGGTQVGVSINNSAQYTNDPNVTLTIVAPPGTTSLLVSNDGGFSAGLPSPVVKTLSWKLDSSGPERLPKTVYVRFLTGTFASPNYTDDIILDERPPIVDSASLSGNAASASVAKLKSYTVKVKAHDTNSGVAGVQVTANKKKPGRLLAYKKKLKLKSAARPKFLRAKDRAGNFSGWKKLR